jgi:hypothetical protein
VAEIRNVRSPTQWMENDRASSLMFSKYTPVLSENMGVCWKRGVITWMKGTNM